MLARRLPDPRAELRSVLELKSTTVATTAEAVTGPMPNKVAAAFTASLLRACASDALVALGQVCAELMPLGH